MKLQAEDGEGGDGDDETAAVPSSWGGRPTFANVSTRISCIRSPFLF